MTGYTKLFGSIIASTIWREPNETRIVWITMLAMANKNGVVEASVPGLADMARVTVPQCQEAIKALESADEWSRTKEHEGRRIQAIDGGWAILNHAKYRAKMGADERREYFRVKKAESRAKSKSPKRVNKSPRLSTPSTQSEAEPKAEKEVSAHAVFVKMWNDEYPKHHDGDKYAMQGGKDGLQLKAFLTSIDKPVSDLIKFAVLAWKHPLGFRCKAAATITGFCTQFNDIREEIRSLKGAMSAPSVPTERPEWIPWLEAMSAKDPKYRDPIFREYQFAPSWMRGDFQKEQQEKKNGATAPTP